jgi:pimeloyl-ACP methyl ester carboxylesterase
MRRTPGPALWLETGGAGTPTLVLLHGLGANAAVWEPMTPILEARWRGRWLAPDLRGHGRSEHRAPYALGTHAADVADLLEPGEEVVLLGHSMGGAVAMALASGWFGVRVRQVVAIGVKLVWTPEEVAKARDLARAPLRRFATREDAIDRHLRVSGLRGLIDPGSPAAALGVVEAEQGFRLAVDPRVNGVVGVPIEDVVAALRAPLRLAAGEHDPMTTLAQMRRFDPQALIIPGVGHNPHVEAPEKVWRLLEDALA